VDGPQQISVLFVIDPAIAEPDLGEPVDRPERRA
jgi:hypothetical protein